MMIEDVWLIFKIVDIAVLANCDCIICLINVYISLLKNLKLQNAIFSGQVYTYSSKVFFLYFLNLFFFK